MIRVDRSSVTNPFASGRLAELAAREQKKMIAIVSSGETIKGSEFRAFSQREVRDALRELFHGKCAYCETQISAGTDGDVEHFRPKRGVTEAPEHPGYWWLANDWDNLLISCHHCNRQRNVSVVLPENISSTGELEAVLSASETAIGGKGSRFPLKDAEARAFSPSDVISAETPLLLDPTGSQDPQDHLVFDEKGLVFSDTEQGNTTIAVLGLNRVWLVENRRATLATFNSLKDLAKSALKGGLEELPGQILEQIKEMAEPRAPYAGMIRQHVARFLNEVAPEQELASVKPERKASRTSKARLKRAKSSHERFLEAQSDYSLSTPEGVRKFLSQDRYVQSISLKNMRGIRTLTLDLEAMTGGKSSWLMLLGENGTGKSTVLQGIALALAGPDRVRTLLKERQINPASMVRYRCQSGEVRVQMSGFTAPHVLTFYRNRMEFSEPHGRSQTVHLDAAGDSQGWQEPTLILGFGATRLLPRRGTTPNVEGQVSKIANLFDSFVPLSDARAWLLSLPKPAWQQVEKVLISLLDLEDTARLKRSAAKGEVWVKTASSKTELGDLSDGYQSVIAVTADLMAMFLGIWPKLSEAMGLVLIDELDAHLHPTWQMKIVSSLRQVLGKVQFIATSHQPLCLRGLRKGEVVVMRQDADGSVTAVSDLPSPEEFRVDQLLTSDFFGLHSTVDPATEAMFDNYYALLAIEEPTDAQKREMERLTAFLDRRDHLGHTERERLYFRAIDILLAEQRTNKWRPQEELEDEALARIRDLWTDVLGDKAAS